MMLVLPLAAGRPMRVLAVAALCVFVGSSCGDSPEQGGSPSGQASANGVIACFPDDGPIAFTVNGVPVPEKTIARLAAYHRSIAPYLTEEQAKAKAIDDDIIATAAVYAAHRDRLPEWSKEIRDAERRLAQGEDVLAVARSISEAGGDLPSFRRDTIRPLLGEVAFRLEAGGVSEPVVTVFGGHLVRLSGKIDGSSAAQDQIRAAHVLVPFDKEAIKDQKAWSERCMELKKEARAESVKDVYKKLVPAFYRR